MAHAHQHPESERGYNVEQLCTIAFCGALGGVAVMMYQRDMLRHILAPQFHNYVLIGGILLLALVAVRAVSLWVSAPKPAHNHDHQHAHQDGSGCDHVHGPDCGHDYRGHEQSHDHGSMPLRYAVLLLPVLLYLLNLPNAGFSQEHNIDLVGMPAEIDGSLGFMEDKNPGVVTDLAFKELSRAALSVQTREYLEANTGRLKGQYKEIKAKECTLFRLKMNCCAADAIPLQVRILCKEALPSFVPGEWVEVVGQIQFRKKKGMNEYMPVLLLNSTRQIVATTPDPNPYEY